MRWRSACSLRRDEIYFPDFGPAISQMMKPRTGSRITRTVQPTFAPVDARQTAEVILRSLVCFTHPVLVGQCMEQGEDLDAQARESVRFLLQAISPRT